MFEPSHLQPASTKPTPDRHPMHVIVDVWSKTKGKGGKLWLGGSVASKDTNLLLQNRIQVVWPAVRIAAPTDTVAVRVLRYLDGTGVVHGDPSLKEVLDQVDEVFSLLLAGFNVLVPCHNGAPRSATLRLVLKVQVLKLRLLGFTL